MSDGLLILGDQLFPRRYWASFKNFKALMIEDRGLCTHFKYHQKKLVLFLSAMRHFREEMKELFDLTYRDLDQAGGFLDKLDSWLRKNKISHLHMVEVDDRFFERELQSFLSKIGIKTIFHPSPKFLQSRESYVLYLKGVKKPMMRTYYERMREQTGILMKKNGEPEGGKFSFDEANRKPYRSKELPPSPAWIEPDSITKEVMSLVRSEFDDHPGEAQDFRYPVARKDVLKWLRGFLKEKFDSFGPYEDALHLESPFLFHSLLSPYLNMGLLTPDEVLEAVIEEYQSDRIRLESAEGFIRQVMGWREFIRGIDQNFGAIEEQKNFFHHQRKLTSAWYQAKTGIMPLDHAIAKVWKYGFTHHIERLMVLSNLMLLCRISPQDVYRWFMEMFIDSADWVMTPNVYGMGQFSDGGIFATKPYICGSNYILKMSNYEKGPWCQEVDALYWAFIADHRNFFESNPRLSMSVKLLDKQGKGWLQARREIAQNVMERLSAA